MPDVLFMIILVVFMTLAVSTVNTTDEKRVKRMYRRILHRDPGYKFKQWDGVIASDELASVLPIGKSDDYVYKTGELVPELQYWVDKLASRDITYPTLVRVLSNANELQNTYDPNYIKKMYSFYLGRAVNKHELNVLHKNFHKGTLTRSKLIDMLKNCEERQVLLKRYKHIIDDAYGRILGSEPGNNVFAWTGMMQDKSIATNIVRRLVDMTIPWTSKGHVSIRTHPTQYVDLNIERLIVGTPAMTRTAEVIFWQNQLISDSNTISGFEQMLESRI